MVSFGGQEKAWATPRSVSFRGLIQNFRRPSPPLSYAESPHPQGATSGTPRRWIKIKWKRELTEIFHRMRHYIVTLKVAKLALLRITDIQRWIGQILFPFNTSNTPGGWTPIWNRRGCSSKIWNLTPKGDHPVSYTHLTLPTIYSV